jgi:hypothetical protein
MFEVLFNLAPKGGVECTSSGDALTILQALQAGGVDVLARGPNDFRSGLHFGSVF